MPPVDQETQSWVQLAVENRLSARGHNRLPVNGPSLLMPGVRLRPGSFWSY